MSKVTLMPWQGSDQAEIEKNLKKEVYSLAKDRELLLKCDADLDYKFEFKIEDYMFIACIMLKYDSNLAETREKIVPGMVSEDEFWRNYFYAIECIKQDMDLPTRLGGRVD